MTSTPWNFFANVRQRADGLGRQSSILGDGAQTVSGAAFRNARCYCRPSTEVFMNRVGIDATDVKILRVLQQNSEYTMQELADKVGLSHTPCWRRYSRLREIGVILGQAAMIDPKKVGMSVN